MQIGLESLLKKESTTSAKDLEHLERRLIAGVCSPIRQTDIAGWFASCSVIGSSTRKSTRKSALRSGKSC
jgi:hypothetical protein